MNMDEAIQHLEGCDLPPPADEARNLLVSVIENVQRLHRRAPDGTCVECYGLAGGYLQWPCPTVQVLDGVVPR